MRSTTVLLILALGATIEAGSGRVEELPGWNVVSDKDLFGEEFVAEFTKFAAKFVEQGGYGQRVPEGHQPTLDAVIKKHGKAKSTLAEEVIVGMGKNYLPEKERFRFHVYGRFGLGLAATDPTHIVWVKLYEPPAK